MDINNIIENIYLTVQSHRLDAEGKYSRWIWQDKEGNRDLGINEYGCADAANILYTTWNKVDEKLKCVAVRSRNKIPYTTINGTHDNKCEDNVSWWTNGFWGGMMWLMYRATGNEEYKTTAIESESLLDDALKKYKELHHDVGFMWHLTSGANYRITGNMQSYNKNLFVASTLFSRYNIKGEYIRAWNDDLAKTWSIIDCMMNIPLLYWASEEIGDERFKYVAMRHADMTMRDHIRDDGSVIHIVEHDENTGEMIKAHR